MIKYVLGVLVVLVGIVFVGCSSSEVEPKKEKKNWISRTACKLMKKNEECKS